MIKPARISNWVVRQRQGLSLELKVKTSLLRIIAWYEYFHGDVYVAFSGGVDSTAMLHLVRSIYPKVPAVFCDTGLEFPEIKQFVRETSNIITIRPKSSFVEVLRHYGYPVISKEQAHYIDEVRNTSSESLRQRRLNGTPQGRFKISKKWLYMLEAPFKISDKCCLVMKKRPFRAFEKKTGLHSYLGVMAEDSSLRNQSYMQHSCNAYNMKHPISRPIMFWLKQDIWDYLKLYQIPYSTIYDMGYKYTGCIFCSFGLHMEGKPGRFDLMKKTHPGLYRYCMDKLELRKVLEWYPIKKEQK